MTKKKDEFEHASTYVRNKKLFKSFFIQKY